MFCHHCPFIGNCVGARNYGWFFTYICCFVAATGVHAATAGLWLYRLGFDALTAAECVHISLYFVMGFGLLQYHLQLITKNLTTNEHQVS